MSDLYLIFNWKTAALFAIVVFVVRPLGVFLSTHGSTLKFNEKLFISWVGPRGIVAAGIASLFGSKLLQKGVPGAEYITPLVFMIVLGTVLLNATTARLFAKAIGVFLKNSEGVLIVGASKLSRLIGNYLKTNGRHVVLIDNNDNNISKSKSLGLEALSTNIYSDILEDNLELSDVGYLMALTGNDEINKYAINKFKKQFGENGSFRIVSDDEVASRESDPEEGLFSYTHNYNKLCDIAKQFPNINEIEISNEESLKKITDLINNDENSIPLFIKNELGELTIYRPSQAEDYVAGDNYKMVYLGKAIDVEKTI